MGRGLVEQAGSRRWASYRLAQAVPVSPAAPTAPVSGPASGRRRDARGEILLLLEGGGEHSRTEIAATLGLGGAVVRKWLTALRDEGLIALTTTSPRSKHARYRLVRTGEGAAR